MKMSNYPWQFLVVLFVSVAMVAGCQPIQPVAVEESNEQVAAEPPAFPLSEPDYTSKRIRDLGPFEDALASFTPERATALDEALTYATIPDIQAMFDAGDLTSVELVTYYVDRIRRYDIDKLNSVMELNPNALADAAAADEMRAAGTVLSPMQGIPLLLKDNIATGDGTHTTAGAYVLKDWQADRDAFLVQQLRNNGAIVFGKANLSEWANYMDPAMPSGFSALGGQTRHPYGPFDPLGSSSGSAVSVAANLTTVSVGSETSGSITAPSQSNSVVGLKTTWGLVSGDYVIPLVDWLDVAGPVGRNVTDVAVLLTAMTGVDEMGEADAELAEMQTIDYTQFASMEAAQGLVVALPIYDEAALEVAVDFYTAQGVNVTEELRAVIAQGMEAQTSQNRALGELMTTTGMSVVEVSAGDIPLLHPDMVTFLAYGFQDSLNRFAASAGGDFPIESLADVVAANNEDLANRAPYGQGYTEASLNTQITADENAVNVETAKAESIDALNAVLEEAGADVILIDDNMISYPVAGFPSITLPLAYAESGQPVGLRLVAGYLDEPELIAVAYALEQALQARVAPDLDATMESFTGLHMAVPAVE